MVGKGQFCKDCVHCVESNAHNKCCARTAYEYSVIDPVSGREIKSDGITLCNVAHGGWRCKYERRRLKMECDVKCRRCGWQGDEGELPYVTVHEDYGDVSTVKCPGCGTILYDGMDWRDLFEEVA